MYQRTLALRTNPFNPAVPAAGIANLAGDPLRLDRHPELGDLICWEMGGLPAYQAWVDEMAEMALRERIVVIRGGRGTGKTTFASYVKRKLSSAPAPKGKWSSWDLELPRSEGPVDIEELSARFEALKTAVVTKLGAGPGSVLLFIDNLPNGGTDLFTELTNLYESLKCYFRAMVVTTEDQALSRDQLDWYAPEIKLFEIENSTPSDLHKYVRRRVSWSRDPNRAELEAASELFPFAPEAVQRVMGGENVPRQTLRVMTHRLAREIEEHDSRLRADGGAIDVGLLSPDELAPLLIR
jgi:hypothetical protein